MSQDYNAILSRLKEQTGFQVGGGSVPTYKKLQQTASEIYHGGASLEDDMETPITVRDSGNRILKTPLVLRHEGLKITMEVDPPLPSSSALSCVREGRPGQGGRMLWSALIGTVDRTSRGIAEISLYPKEGIIVARDPAGNTINIVVNTGQKIRSFH